MRLAYLFPGQGAQAVGMGEALARGFDAARHVFEVADRVLGYSLSRICWEGPEPELRKTVHAQPALLTHSVAALRLMEAAGMHPSWAAGHSLGEYSATVAAGAIEFEDALRLVRRRGELMYQAGLERPGTMAAILGLAPEEVERLCNEASTEGTACAANVNAPGQVVISGDVAAVEKACALAKAQGAKRAIRLEVNGAFHSPLMTSAARGLNEALDAVAVRDATGPVVVNAWAKPVVKAAEIRSALKQQLLAPVRWEDSMRFLLHDADRFVEIGPGRVLRGLLRTIDKNVACWNVEDPESLQLTLTALGVSAPIVGGRA
jgi:[acyl-carrier-protein] S-malonyltransferase